MAAYARLLFVDDSRESCSTARFVLAVREIEVDEANDVITAIGLIRSRSYDLVMIDCFLDDTRETIGLEIVDAIHRAGQSMPPWLLFSGWMTPEVARRAMKLGALDAVSCPFDIDKVSVTALQVARRQRGWPKGPLASHIGSPKSAVERLASLVLKACDAEHDLKTIEEWATFVGVSRASLTALCRLVGIEAHNLRDFMRVMRALNCAGGRVPEPCVAFDIADSRTMKTFWDRSGLSNSVNEAISPREFVSRQRIIHLDHYFLPILLSLLQR